MANGFKKLVLTLPLVALASCSGDNSAEMTYGTPQQFMANHVQITADVYWGSVKFESELMDDGTVVERDIRPETDEQWEEVRASAEQLGVWGDVLLSDAYANGRGDDWMVYSQGLIDVAQLAEQAAIEKDPDAVFTAGGTVYSVCRACHQMYPPAIMPEGTEEGDFRPSDDVSFEEYTDG